MTDTAVNDNQVKPFPRGVLASAGALAVLTIAVAAVARLTGMGVTDVNPSPPAQALTINFEDRADGAINVFDADRGRLIHVLTPGTSGFVRVVMRSLVRERRGEGIGRDKPFRLTRWADGRLSIDDPATGRHIDLGAFGSSNTASFARLLVTERTQ
jgi:putative photosynthetic complex assembly protein